MRLFRASFSLSIGCLLLSMACSESGQGVLAKRIEDRAELIGGPGALGEVGDYLLKNQEIRVIIQDKGFSRGFGVYGGSLIDADLVRPAEFGSSAGGTGFDNFAELFPGLFADIGGYIHTDALRNSCNVLAPNP